MRSALLWFGLLAIALTGCEIEISARDEGERQPRPVSPRPIEVPVVNLPRDLREWNWGGGSCVHAGTVMDFRWCDQFELAAWWRKTYSGGESFNGLTAKLRQAKVPYYETHTGDVAVLERCHAERRGAVIFYYTNHSVLLVHFDDEKAILLDNNRIDQFIEIPRDTFVRNWRAYGGVAIVPTIGSPAPPLPYLAAR